MILHHTLWNEIDPKLHPSPPKLILLHGMGGTGSLWRPIASSLENKMIILTPDQRGHGRSQVLQTSDSESQIRPSYTPLDYGQDLVDTMESIPFFPAWILGHSMGVRTAVAAAHLKPEWTHGLILVDLGFHGIAGGGLGEGLSQFLKILPQEFSSKEQAREFMTQNCPDPSMAQYLMAVSVREDSGKICFPFDHSALIQTIHAARNCSIREWLLDLAQKKVPVLVLRGKRSLVWSEREFQTEKTLFQDYDHVVFEEIPDAGHGLPFEQRLVFAEKVEKFISGRSTVKGKKD